VHTQQFASYLNQLRPSRRS